MKKYVDILFKSMTEKDSSIMPLSSTYSATENSIASALSNMNCWRTVTKLNYIGQLHIDEAAGQIFVTANLDESGMETIFFGRLKVENELITELELNIIRSRSDSGFVYLPEQMNTLPYGWTSEIPENGKATREELADVGHAIFNEGGPNQYEPSEHCILMEIGGIVYEDPDYLQTLSNPDEEAPESKELVTIPGGLWPGRPQDSNARVVVIDEENGVVISAGTVQGYVCPYVVEKETGSCFVPACMIEQHRRTLDPAMFEGRNVIKEMKACASTVEMVRFHSGKIQGMHRYIHLQGPGASSPWV